METIKEHLQHIIRNYDARVETAKTMLESKELTKELHAKFLERYKGLLLEELRELSK